MALCKKSWLIIFLYECSTESLLCVMQLELIWHADCHCRNSVSWTMQSCNPHNFEKWSSRERNFKVSLSRYTSKYWCCQDYIKTELSFTQGKTRYIILYKNVICCHCFIVSYFTRYKSQKRCSCLDEFHLISRLCQFMRFKKNWYHIYTFFAKFALGKFVSSISSTSNRLQILRFLW